MFLFMICRVHALSTLERFKNPTIFFGFSRSTTGKRPTSC